MIELSNERVEQILHKETQKTEELATILRGVYTRYMRLYEKYFADIEALNDGEIADLKRYHEETGSLMKYYYMDIPKDVCAELQDFDEKYTAKLLGADWHNCLFDSYEAFRVENEDAYPSEKQMKAEYAKQTLAAFYEAMDSVFRESFGTGSKTAEKVASGIASLFFGKQE